MISWAPIWAVVIRYTRVWQKDPNLLLAGLYWPLLDILIWGFLGTWIAQSQTGLLHNYKIVALLGVLLWQFIARGCNAICMMICEEIWAKNVVNLFSLPLRISEWIIGITIFYAIYISLLTLFCMLVITHLYDIPFWHLLSTFLIFAPPLFFCGIWIGFTCLQIIVSLGKSGIEIGYIFAWFMLPFSGSSYPIEILPAWAQTFSSYLPMSYVFAGMRTYLMYHHDPTPFLIKGYLLSIIYAACSILLFIYAFNRSKKNGLARLTE